MWFLFCGVSFEFQSSKSIVWLVAINVKYMLGFIYVECNVMLGGGIGGGRTVDGLDFLSRKLS